MKIHYLLFTVAPLALSTPVWAENAADAPTETAAKSEDMVTTGVAKGRDRLDSATSTSSLKATEIAKIAPRSLGEVFRSIPGMRVEAPGGEGNAAITIRGLPLAQGGAKFLQLQEDGLPTLEFGDIGFATADNFLRADLNLSQIESIRGGSASTFASNSPGGIINLISKTGDVEGGSIQASAGIDYEEYRTDFDYGAKLSDTLRFHVGGFYRVGEGPRKVGYDAYKGGQIKLNVTKEFTGGYIRFYGKLLDDRTPYYGSAPMRVTGSNSNPTYTNLPGFDVREDSLYTRNFLSNTVLGAENNLERHRVEGMHSKSASFGVETQFQVSDWTITDKFRFSSNSGSAFVPSLIGAVGPAVDTADAIATSLGAPGGTLRYATGPNAGQLIGTNINGNGLLAKVTNQDTQLKNLDFVVNDLRASRVWELGNADLTTTVGFYKSSQNIGTVWNWTSSVMEIAGNGSANLVNVYRADNTPVTQDGYYGYSSAYIFGARRSYYDMTYGVNAPYASFNYHTGKISVGGSIRYDYGTARGQILGSELLAPTDPRYTSRDMNGDGVISDAETRVGFFNLSKSTSVNYNYHYWSYSTGVNYRVAEPFALFARYSRGSRANADRIVFEPRYINFQTGGLARPDAAYDPVQQAEIGAKWRKDGLTLNLTGFWAKTKEHNISLDRSYRAYGLEFEGGIRKGPWSLTASATYTNAKITADAIVATNVDHTPKHQPDLIFQAMPQYTTDNFSVGASIIGTTGSYTTDVNGLKLPGFTTVGTFVQYRPVERVLLSVNANNLFNTTALIAGDQDRLPTNGIATVQALNGRTVSTSIKFDF